MKTSSATQVAVPRHIFLRSSFLRNSILISTLGLIGSLATSIAHAQTNLAQGKTASVTSSVDVYTAGNTIDGNQA
uniref:hypothetical protein n=1 Tax=Cellvibrio sp. UBA7661 TaxID=1946311 RepID=UPI002F34F3A8